MNIKEIALRIASEIPMEERFSVETICMYACTALLAELSKDADPINWKHLVEWWQSGSEDWEGFQEVVKKTFAESAQPVESIEQRPVAWKITFKGGHEPEGFKTVHYHGTNAIADYRVIDPNAESDALYTHPQPVEAIERPKQPWPNHNWCVGCSPESCSGCGTAPVERRKETVEAVEQRVANACVAYLEDKEVERTNYCMSVYEEGERYKSEAIEAIRQGKWKEFVK